MVEETPAAATDDYMQAETAPKKVRHRKKKLYQAILQQMEFYFSDSNLLKDRFLGKLVHDSGHVDLSVFLSFNRIRRLTSSAEDLAKALRNSEMLTVSEDGTKVYRVTPVKVKENVDDCTIYVEQLPPDADHDWLRGVFSAYGKVTYVSIPKYRGSGKIKGFAFVEFDTPEEANRTLEAFGAMGCCLPTKLPPEQLCSISTFEQDDKDGLVLPKEEGAADEAKQAEPVSEQESEEQKLKKKRKRNRDSDEKDEEPVSEQDNEEQKPKQKRKQNRGSDEKDEEPVSEQENEEQKPKQKRKRNRGSDEKVEELVSEQENEEQKPKQKRKRNRGSDEKDEEPVSEHENEEQKPKQKWKQNRGSNEKDEEPVSEQDNEEQKPKQKRKRNRGSDDKDEESVEQVESPVKKKKKRRKSETVEETEESDKGTSENVEEKPLKKKKKEADSLVSPETEAVETSRQSKKRKHSEETEQTRTEDEDKEDAAEQEDDDGCRKRFKGEDSTDEQEGEGVHEEGRKRKRNRKRKKKSKKDKPETDGTKIGLRILSKREWKRLRNKYLELQRKKMKAFKQYLARSRWAQVKQESSQGSGDNLEVEDDVKNGVPESQPRTVFTPGVIIHCQLDTPVADVKKFKADAKAYPDVKYVDVKEGDSEVFLRCSSAEAAKQLVSEKPWEQMSVIEGEEETAYWEKIKRDREEKLGKKVRVKQRGRDRLLKKAETVLGKHMRFDDLDD